MDHMVQFSDCHLDVADTMKLSSIVSKQKVHTEDLIKTHTPTTSFSIFIIETISFFTSYKLRQ